MEKRMEKKIGLLKFEQGSSQARPNLSESEYPTLFKSTCRKGRSGEGQRKCRFHCIVYQKCVLYLVFMQIALFRIRSGNPYTYGLNLLHSMFTQEELAGSSQRRVDVQSQD